MIISRLFAAAAPLEQINITNGNLQTLKLNSTQIGEASSSISFLQLFMYILAPVILLFTTLFVVCCMRTYSQGTIPNKILPMICFLVSVCSFLAISIITVFLFMKVSDITTTLKKSQEITKAIPNDMKIIVTQSNAAAINISQQYEPTILNLLPQNANIQYVLTFLNNLLKFYGGVMALVPSLKIDALLNFQLLLSNIQSNINNKDYISLISNVTLFENQSQIIKADINSIINKFATASVDSNKLTDTTVTIQNIASVVPNSILDIQTTINSVKTNIDPSAVDSVTSIAILDELADILDVIFGMLPSQTSIAANDPKMDFVFNFMRNDVVLSAAAVTQLKTVVKNIMPNVTDMTGVKTFFYGLIPILNTLGYQKDATNSSADVEYHLQTFQAKLIKNATFLEFLFQTLGTNDFQKVILTFQKIVQLFRNMNFKATLASSANTTSKLLEYKLITYDPLMLELNNFLQIMNNYNNYSGNSTSVNLITQNITILNQYNAAMTKLTTAGVVNPTSGIAIDLANKLINTATISGFYSFTDTQTEADFLNYLESLKPTLMLSKIQNIDNTINSILGIKNFLILVHSAMSTKVTKTITSVNNISTDFYFENYKLAGWNTENSTLSTAGIDYLNMITNLHNKHMQFIKVTMPNFFNQFPPVSASASSDWTTLASSIIGGFNTKLSNADYKVTLTNVNKNTIYKDIMYKNYNFAQDAIRVGILTAPLNCQDKKIIYNDSTSAFLLDLPNGSNYPYNNLITIPTTNSDATKIVMAVLNGSSRQHLLSYIAFSSWYRDQILMQWFEDNNIVFTPNLISKVIKTADMSDIN